MTSASPRTLPHLKVYLEWGLDKAVGVELSCDRHTRAEAAAARLLSKLDRGSVTGQLELRNANILETNLGEMMHRESLREKEGGVEGKGVGMGKGGWDRVGHRQ